jgi:hypothetical protein
VTGARTTSTEMEKNSPSLPLKMTRAEMAPQGPNLTPRKLQAFAKLQLDLGVRCCSRVLGEEDEFSPPFPARLPATGDEVAAMATLLRRATLRRALATATSSSSCNPEAQLSSSIVFSRSVWWAGGSQGCGCPWSAQSRY